MNQQMRILKPFMRGLPIIIMAMIAGVLIARKYLTYVTPMYESTAKLKLADVKEGIPGSNLFKDFDVFATSSKIAAEIELMKSGALLNKALDSLDFDLEIYRIGKIRAVELYHEAPFMVHTSFKNQQALNKKFHIKVVSPEAFILTLPDGGASIKGKFGEVMDCTYGQILVQLNKPYLAAKPNATLIDQYEFVQLSRERLMKQVTTHLDINPVDKDVAVVRMTYQSPVPEKAAALVNRLSQAYIYDYIESKYKAAGTTVSFLDKQIEQITKRLNQSEQEIETYRDDRGITNIRQETETDLRAIAQMKIQLANEKMTLKAMNDLYKYIQGGKHNFLELAPNFEAFTDLLSTEIVKNIKKLQAEKKDLLLVYTPDEDRVKVIDKKIEDLKQYLIESIGNTKRNHEVKLAQLQEEITTAEQAFIGVPEKEKILNSMNRDFELFQKSYNFLNEKKIEAEIARAAKMSFHRVIEQAVSSEKPVSPNSAIIVIVSAILGMIGAMVLIYGVHIAKAKVNDSYTIEKSSHIPVSGEIPLLTEQILKTRYFHKLALQLELKQLLSTHQVVTITSFSSGEGKGFLTAGLAAELNQQQRRVLLLTSETNTTTLGSLAWVTQKHLEAQNLASLSAAALAQRISEYKTEFDVVLICNEALSKSTHALALMHIADTNLFLFDSRKTAAKQISAITLLAEEYQLPRLSFILNRAHYNPNVLIQVWTWVKQLRVWKLR